MNNFFIFLHTFIFNIFFYSIKILNYKVFITLAGIPTANELAGMSFVTTLPDPITTLLPMVTPLLIVQFDPIQTLSQIFTGKQLNPCL